MLGPILRGEKISLEPAQLEDLPIFIRWFADPDITRTLLVRFPPSLKQEEEWYDRVASDDTTVHWKLVAGGRTIGVTGIHDIDRLNRHATTGTVIGERSEWGKGYASEAVRLRTVFAFEELGLERLETESFAHNRPMHRALEKSGYSKIGTRHRYIYRGGEWLDAHIFELLRDDWLARQH